VGPWDQVVAQVVVATQAALAAAPPVTGSAE
jgi:hypothetical protein